MDPASRTDVYVSGQEGYHTYRIPALLGTQAGTLLAFCEGRRNGPADHGDIDLLVKRSSDGGVTWSRHRVVYTEEGDVTIGNPCPVLDQSNGRIILPFCRDNDDVLVTFSDDDGESWSPPRDITADVKRADWTWYATGPGVGIQMRGDTFHGRIVIPCDHNSGDGTRESHVFYSDDGGESWALGGSIGPGANECQVAELSDGRLMLNMRMQEEQRGFRAVSFSEDGGETWSELCIDQRLPEPVCQASLIPAGSVAPGGPVQLLFSNPAKRTGRTTLTVRLSPDDGGTWPCARVLQQGHSAYSSLALLGDGNAACLYETGEHGPYERIEFCGFPIHWLKEG